VPEPPAVESPAPKQAAETPPAAAPKPAAADSKPAEPSDEAKMMEAHKDSPVVKAATEAAKPTELPKAPSRNGLDLDGLEGK
jgi:hypothetical protein